LVEHAEEHVRRYDLDVLIGREGEQVRILGDDELSSAGLRRGQECVVR
jgi:hypothetical protein